MARIREAFVTTAARLAYEVKNEDVSGLFYDNESGAYYRAIASGTGAGCWSAITDILASEISNDAENATGDTVAAALDDLDDRIATLENA